MADARAVDDPPLRPVLRLDALDAVPCHRLSPVLSRPVSGVQLGLAPDLVPLLGRVDREPVAGPVVDHAEAVGAAPVAPGVHHQAALVLALDPLRQPLRRPAVHRLSPTLSRPAARAPGAGWSGRRSCAAGRGLRSPARPSSAGRPTPAAASARRRGRCPAGARPSRLRLEGAPRPDRALAAAVADRVAREPVPVALDLDG